MIKLSKLTDYAIVVLTEMARAQGDVRTFAAANLACKTGVPEPTVAKLLKTLGRGGIVASCRGASGGYSLVRAPMDISIADIILTLEGPIALTDCVGGHSGDCHVEKLCPVRGNWDKINGAIRIALEAVSLADMAMPVFPLPHFEINKMEGAA